MGHDDGMDQSSAPVRTAPATLRPRPGSPAFLDLLDDAASRFARTAARGDLAAAVPACPGWTLADLVAHLGGTHQWAAHAVAAGTPDGQVVPAPTGREALLDWYRDSAGTLCRTLRSTDPLAPAWTFGLPPATASFWHRRQAHETVMHLRDAEESQGGPVAPIAHLTALDGIDEVVGMFFPRQVALGRIRPLEHRIALTTTAPGRPDPAAADLTGPGGTGTDGTGTDGAGTDGAGPDRWVLAGDGTGADSVEDVAATVSGPPEALLLLLWRRAGLDDGRLALDGDVTVARAVLARALTP